MWLAPSLQHDASLSSVWVEAEFPPSVLPEPRRSDKVFSKRGAISPQLRATVPLASTQLDALADALHAALRRRTGAAAAAAAATDAAASGTTKVIKSALKPPPVVVPVATASEPIAAPAAELSLIHI